MPEPASSAAEAGERVRPSDEALPAGTLASEDVLDIAPWPPSVQRSISTNETITVELWRWEISENGGPFYSPQHDEPLGQRWRRSFELTLTDVDRDLRVPGSRTGRVFESAVDSFTRVYEEPSTGPKDALWSFHGWPEHLALELVKSGTAADASYVAAEDQPVEGLSQERLNSLRGDCALTGLARWIAEQGSMSTVVHVEPSLLRDMLFPGGDLFELEFSPPEDDAHRDARIWYEPWPSWEFVGRSAQFGRCSGTIELERRPAVHPRDGDRTTQDPPRLTIYAVKVRVQCRTDSSNLLRAQKERYGNDLELMQYEGRIETTYALDGELVYDGAASVVRSVRLTGPVTISDSLESLRNSRESMGFSKCRGFFKASGTLEHTWATRPGR